MTVPDTRLLNARTEALHARTAPAALDDALTLIADFLEECPKQAPLDAADVESARTEFREALRLVNRSKPHVMAGIAALRRYEARHSGLKVIK